MLSTTLNIPRPVEPKRPLIRQLSTIWEELQATGILKNSPCLIPIQELNSYKDIHCSTSQCAKAAAAFNQEIAHLMYLYLNDPFKFSDIGALYSIINMQPLRNSFDLRKLINSAMGQATAMYFFSHTIAKALPEISEQSLQLIKLWYPRPQHDDLALDLLGIDFVVVIKYNGFPAHSTDRFILIAADAKTYNRDDLQYIGKPTLILKEIRSIPSLESAILDSERGRTKGNYTIRDYTLLQWANEHNISDPAMMHLIVQVPYNYHVYGPDGILTFTHDDRNALADTANHLSNKLMQLATLT